MHPDLLQINPWSTRGDARMKWEKYETIDKVRNRLSEGIQTSAYKNYCK